MSLLQTPGLVSTVIPVFNQADPVIAAVRSVLAQTHRPIEIIIVDDGSTDDTPNKLKVLANEHAEIRVFSQVNRGPGPARETGRLNARGEFIQYLDCCEELAAEKFSFQLAAFAANPDCDAVYGRVEFEDCQGMPTIAEPAMFPAFLMGRCWTTATPLYRRGVIDRAGPWLDIRYGACWEY